MVSFAYVRGHCACHAELQALFTVGQDIGGNAAGEQAEEPPDMAPGMGREEAARNSEGF